MCYLSAYLVNEIRHCLANRDCDPVRLARSACVKPSNLLRILEGKYSPSIEVLERLYVCLGLQVEVHRGCNTYANGPVYDDSFSLVDTSSSDDDLPF